MGHDETGTASVLSQKIYSTYFIHTKAGWIAKVKTRNFYDSKKKVY